MVGTFKAKNPLNTFLLFIYGLLLKFSFFSHLPVPQAEKTDGILFRELLLVLQTISNQTPLIYSLITYLLLFTQAISFNKIVNDQRLIQRPTYLPAMSYLLITSIFPEWNILNGSLIVNSLLIWVWYKINTLYNSSSPKAALFNIGIAIGTAALFYFPALAFALLVIFALLLVRPFKFSEWIIALMGIITPFYYLLTWLFLSDNLTFYKYPVLFIGYPDLYRQYWLLGAAIALIIAFIAGAFYVQANVRKQLVQIRKGWNLLALYVLIAVLTPFISDAHSFKYWIITAVPLSAFIACAFFYPPKKWFPLLLHWAIVGFVIVISYYNK